MFSLSSFKAKGLRAKPVNQLIYRLRLAYDHKGFDRLKPELLELVRSKAFLEMIVELELDYYESFKPFFVWLSQFHPELVDSIMEALNFEPFKRSDFLILNESRSRRDFFEDLYLQAKSEISAKRTEIILSRIPNFFNLSLSTDIVPSDQVQMPSQCQLYLMN